MKLSAVLLAAFAFTATHAFLEAGDAPQELAPAQAQEPAPLADPRAMAMKNMAQPVAKAQPAAKAVGQPVANPKPGFPDAGKLHVVLDSLQSMMKDDADELGEMQQVGSQIQSLPEENGLEMVSQNTKAEVTKIQEEVRKAGEDQLKMKSDAGVALEQLSSAIEDTKVVNQEKLGESYLMGKSHAKPAKPQAAHNKDYSEALKHYERVNRALSVDSEGSVDPTLKNMEVMTENLLKEVSETLGESNQPTPQEQIQDLKQELKKQQQQQQEQIQHLQQALTQVEHHEGIQTPAAPTPDTSEQQVQAEAQEEKAQPLHRPAEKAVSSTSSASHPVTAVPESTATRTIPEETKEVDALLTADKVELQDDQNMVSHTEKMIRDLKEGIAAARGAH